jgi:hypothetical protein
MTLPMDDEQVQARIEELEREEQRLRSDEQAAADTGGADQVAADARHVEEVRVALDRLWDYLRRRRALRDAGQDPNTAQLRDAETVERYLG